MGKGNDGKDDASGLKEAGNKAFASGDLEQARTLYTKALECSGDASAQVINFRATVLSNRAMVLFKQGKALECVADCTSALELDPGRVKAYFRRALAREQLHEDADALRDAKRALELEPGNKEAVKAARRIKDKVAKAAKLNTPIVQALKALREAAETVRKHTQEQPAVAAEAPLGKGGAGGEEQRSGVTAAACSEEDAAQSRVMLALGALLSTEPSATVQLLREGCMVPLSVCMKAAATFPKTAKEALRALGAAAQHKAFGLVLLQTQGVELLSDLADTLVAERARSDAGEGSPVAEAVLSTAVHLLQWDEHAVVDRLDELPEVNREQVEGAGKELADAAVKVLAQGLKMRNREVFDTALEAVVRWCSPRSDDEPQPSDDSGLPAKEAYEKRQKAHRRRVRLSLWVRDKGLALFSSSAVVSLYKALSSEEPVERRKASACLSRVGRAVTSVQANENEREADSQKIKDAVSPLLQFQPEAGGGSVAEAKGEGEAFAAISAESRMQGTVRRVTIASALSNAEGALGTWAMSLQGFLAEAMTLAASGDQIGQEAAAESFCSAASSDGGRALLGPVVESGVIFVLMESRSQAARSAAASAYAKLGMISAALSSDSDDVTKLLNVSLDLIAPSTKPTATADTASSKTAASKPGRGLDTLKGGAELADSERAVEVLSFLVSKTKVKEELCYGSARCQKALSRLCQAGHHVKGTSPIAYGLAFLYSSLCVSKEEEVKESFKGKDMTYEQYQQLKQLNDSHGQGPKEDETDTKDSADAAQRRSHALAEAGCVLSLKKLAEDASPATRERVALCFRRLATEPRNRGLIVQQGGLSLLINMAATPSVSEGDSATKKDDKGKGCILEARHAIAKTLVTTNPHLLTEAQTMGSVPALIAMCRDHESLNIQQFEGLMALTNLASLDNVKSRIIAEKGISCFHYLQFSDHEMIRRASTEAMCNLLPHQKMFDHLKSADTLKLWAAFSQLGTEDPPTAAAALGCLAMAVRDPEVATGFMADEVGGCDALVHALLSVEPDIPNADDLILRAAVLTAYLAEQGSLRPLLLLGGVADALTEALAVSKDKDSIGAARAADACASALEALKQEMPSMEEGLLALD